jgi:hypothetical protein
MMQAIEHKSSYRKVIVYIVSPFGTTQLLLKAVFVFITYPLRRSSNTLRHCRFFEARTTLQQNVAPILYFCDFRERPSTPKYQWVFQHFSLNHRE